jgi:hypothetical protein
VAYEKSLATKHSSGKSFSSHGVSQPSVQPSAASQWCCPGLACRMFPFAALSSDEYAAALGPCIMNRHDPTTLRSYSRTSSEELTPSPLSTSLPRAAAHGPSSDGRPPIWEALADYQQTGQRHQLLFTPRILRIPSQLCPVESLTFVLFLS